MSVLLWNIVSFCDTKRDQWHVFFWDFVWWFWWTEVVMSLSGFWNFLVKVSFDHAPFSDLDRFISSFMVIPCIYWSSFPFLFRRNSWYVDTKIRWLVQIGGNPIYVLAHDLHGWNVFAWLLFPSNRHASVAGTTSKVFATSILVILVDETGGKGDFKCGKPLFLITGFLFAKRWAERSSKWPLLVWCWLLRSFRTPIRGGTSVRHLQVYPETCTTKPTILQIFRHQPKQSQL